MNCKNYNARKFEMEKILQNESCHLVLLPPHRMASQILGNNSRSYGSSCHFGRQRLNDQNLCRWRGERSSANQESVDLMASETLFAVKLRMSQVSYAGCWEEEGAFEPNILDEYLLNCRILKTEIAAEYCQIPGFLRQLGGTRVTAGLGLRGKARYSSPQNSSENEWNLSDIGSLNGAGRSGNTDWPFWIPVDFYEVFRMARSLRQKNFERHVRRLQDSFREAVYCPKWGERDNPPLAKNYFVFRLLHEHNLSDLFQKDPESLTLQEYDYLERTYNSGSEAEAALGEMVREIESLALSMQKACYIS